MEGQILHCYLKVFSLLIIPLVYFYYIFFIREIVLENEYFIIKSNENHNKIIDNNINDNKFNKFFYKTIIKINLRINQIHFGKFVVNEDINFFNLLITINKPSQYLDKITIVEGWSKYQLNKILKKKFKNYKEIEYNKVVANTYLFSAGSSFDDFQLSIDNEIHNIKNIYKDHNLLKKFSFEEIFIIGSLLEKEGINYNDKQKILSVIFNRLNKNMKLQIDASVIFALTKGKHELGRKLKYEDLKIKDEYNTYYIYGLPPKPISYVGNKTIELIFEGYKTNYLFYFYNSIENRHIFSENYKKHLNKLNEYRSKK